MTHVVLIGLTGAPGSGKSTVAQLLRERGFVVLEADTVAHELMQTDPELRRLLQGFLGEEIFTADGTLKAALLAERLFGPEPQQRKLREAVEELVHPRVLQVLAERIQEAAAAGASHVVVEAALLYEVGLEEAFDYVLVVDAEERLRHQRLRQRGWTDEHIRAREAAQWSARAKRQRADLVLSNNGTLDELRQSVVLLAELLRILPPRASVAQMSSDAVCDDAS